MSEREQREFLLQVLDRGLAEPDIDQVGLLTLNRSDLVVPELLKRIESAVRNRSLADRTIMLMAGMIAYAADERAVDGIARLCELDSKRFEFLVARALDYSTGQKNPYTLAYYALVRHPSIGHDVVQWIERSLEFPSNSSRWARAVLQRYDGPPNDADLRADPIASRLKSGLPDVVRESIEALTKDRNRVR
jgi:hypothetical protein